MNLKMMDNITMAIPTIEKLNRLVGFIIEENTQVPNGINSCLLYTSDAADE